MEAAEPIAAGPPLGRNLAASFLGNACVALVQLAFVPAYIALLGVEAYGLIGVYIVLQASLALLDLGLTPTVGREVARWCAGAATVGELRDLTRSAEIVVSGLALAVLLGMAALAPVIAARWLKVESLPLSTVEHALLLMAVLVAARWFAGLHRSAIAGHQRLVWLNAVVAGFAIARAAGVVFFLLWVGPSIEAFFGYQCAVAIVEAAVLARRAWSLMPSDAPARFSSAALRRIWQFSGGLALVTALYLVLSQADKAMLSALLPLSTFACYSFAASVAGALNLLVAPIGQVAFPTLTGLAARGDERALSAAFHEFAQLMTLAVAPSAVVLALFAEPVLLLWTRDAALSAATAPLLSLLAIGAMLNAFMSTPYIVSLAHGRTAGLVALNALLLVTFVPAIYLGVAEHGAIAAGFAWIAINAMGVALAIPLLRPHVPQGEPGRWLALDVVLPTAAAGAAAALVRLGSRAEADWTVAMLLALAFAGACAAAAAALPLARRRLAAMRASAA